MKKALFAILMACLTLGSAQAQRRDDNGLGETDVLQFRKMQIAQLAITNLYVDSVDQKKLVEDAIKGILEQLDPHSSYSNPEETKKLNEPLEGNFEGIGIQFNMMEDTLVVIQTIRKGPSERVGIVAGDRIISVDGKPIAGVKMDRDSIMRRLRGPKGTHVSLGIVRRMVPEPILFDVVRDKIPVNTLDAAYIVEPGIGYIRLERFGATSGEEVRKAIKELQAQGMKRLIFDLQQNGGGYLGAAVEVASEFLKSGKLVVFTEGRNSPKQIMEAQSGGLFLKGDLIILVDEYTASAAEIVSGAVQDHDRGTIIGRRTFGKGLVQRPVELPDGSMIRLTTSHYYTPSGRCIQKPYEKGNKKEYNKDLETRFNHGELCSIDSVHLDSTKVYRTLEKGRKVYGGGGVMPDVFVPLDTTRYTKFFQAIRRHNILNDQVLRYIDGKRESLVAAYPNFDDYITSYEVPQVLIDSVMSAAKRLKVEPKDSTELETTLPDLRYSLKSLIAYDVWDRNEYFRLINERSDIFKEALRRFRREIKNKK